MASPSPLAPARSFRVIRIAMVGAVLAFGAVGWQQSHARPPAELMPMPATFTYAGVALLLIGLVGAFVVRGRITPQVPPQAQLTLALIALALAEAPAMFGAAVLFVTGDPMLWIAGTLLLLGVALNLTVRD